MGKCKVNFRNLTCAIVCFALVYLLLYGLNHSDQIELKKTSQDEETYFSPKTTIELSDKWIVVTTVSPPTASIAILAAIPEWQLLVVGETMTPTNWSFPGAIYLGVEEQESFGYSITKLIPFKSYTRKNIGYLYAIQHGAQFIYDTDDDNRPNKGIISFELQPTTSGLIYSDTSKGLMNPYAHFGQPSIWPRGFPLDKVTQENNNTYRLTNFKTPAIQQGLVNGNPDVDAIYRLIKHKQNMTSLNVSFDSSAPPITLPEGVFAPFNSQNTLFHRDAFWALLLPASVVFRVTDIWRGYWAQRLMWLIGHQLAFFPPNAVQIRNAHNYIGDFKESIQFYNKSGDFIEFLSYWNCSSETFFACVNKISADMVASEFWSQSDADLVKAWLIDLNVVGYQQPNMSRAHKDESALKITKPKDFNVLFSSSPKIDPSSERRLDLMTFCDGVFNSSTSSDFAKRLGHNQSYGYSNLLLIVVFNFPFYKNVKFLDTLYKDHFPNILFCSQTDSFDKMMQEVNLGIPQSRIRQISFLNITSAKGYFGYECAIRAIEMNYQVDGYLVVADDILLNTWSFQTLDVDQVRFIEGSYFVHRARPPSYWPWWNNALGANVTFDALDEIEQIAGGSHLESEIDSIHLQQIMKQFVERRVRNNINKTIVSIASADMYYVPRTKSTEFLEVMKIFLKHRVFLELAVPTTMAGLREKDLSYHMLKGRGCWAEDRSKLFSFFNTTNEFLHPIKLSQIVSNAKLRQEYCDIYIREMMNSW